LVVAGTDATQLPRDRCVYLLSAVAPRAAGPDAARCGRMLLAPTALVAALTRSCQPPTQAK